MNKWFARIVSELLRSGALVGLVAAELETDPSVPPQVRQDFEVISNLAPIFAAKQPGTLIYKLDADGSETTIAHLAP